MNPSIDKLIVALDLPTCDAANDMVEMIGDAGVFYKIGYQLTPLGGFELARRLSERGKKIFLDLKYHDIGATVERGVASVAKVGADFLTVHAEPDVLAGAIAGRGDDQRLKILAVTVLTNLDQAALASRRYRSAAGDRGVKARAIRCGRRRRWRRRVRPRSGNDPLDFRRRA